MKRFYIAAMAGVCCVAPVGAQDGWLAPTAPVVPPPVLHNGSLVAPAGGAWGGSGSRMFARTTWSPVRSPVVAGYTEAPAAPAPGYTVPPLPPGIGGGYGACGPTSCGPVGCESGRERTCWDRMKAWLCFQPSKTELPKMRPTPYVTPIQGLFGCTSATGCASACGGAYAGGYSSPGQPGYSQPAPPMQPQPMPPGMGAGAVMMPARGTQGPAVQPTWQGRVVSTPSEQPAPAGYKYAQPDYRAAQQPAQGPIVNTGYRSGQK
ncbi:hypothetical protein J8F10_26765 [Gemmata sp. G18]|uniref:Uncharacterized protein n=1 Tax=Gemmata palustris TaxID=2822762 RepID=A0ABS5C060_9BACT|nr:hypothetical protein [Gemmata palustris]MBP3958865.1 hypothetical protein [Gemmata palustris]